MILSIHSIVFEFSRIEHSAKETFGCSLQIHVAIHRYHCPSHRWKSTETKTVTFGIEGMTRKKKTK